MARLNGGRPGDVAPTSTTIAVDELRRGNVVQALVHVATTAPPPYANARPGDWNGLQSYVDRLDDLSAAWIQAEAREMPDRPPLYAFTPSALDPTLAAPGLHTVYLASPAAPAQVSGSWGSREEKFIDRCLDTVERRAPGFRASIVGVTARTPEAMMLTDGWRGAHPMHIDITLDQLGGRPGGSAPTARRSSTWSSPVLGPARPAASPAPPDGSPPELRSTYSERAVHAPAADATAVAPGLGPRPPEDGRTAIDEQQIQLTGVPEDQADVVAEAVGDGVGRAARSGAGGTVAGGLACPDSGEAP
jgi:hypothetical protein